MPIELEEKIMNEIGLGNSYQWHNGSGSCGHTRRNAVIKLRDVMLSHNLVISTAWLDLCNQAKRADKIDDGDYTLTNTFLACSYAIQDAIYRKAGSKGIPTKNHPWRFFSKEKEEEWNNSNQRLSKLDTLTSYFNREDW